MQVRTMGQRPTPSPLPLAGGPPPPRPPDEFHSTPVELVARGIGNGSQFLSMVPRTLETQKWILPTFKLENMSDHIQVAAGIAGGVSTIALAVSGGLQIKEGVQTRNSAELLAGASEIARGGYVGSWTGARLTDYRNTLNPVSNALGFVSGALQTAAGVVRLSHARNADSNVNPKVVGLMEAGMGLTWMGSMLGMHPGVCTAARGALVLAKTAYTHHDKLHLWKDRTQLR